MGIEEASASLALFKLILIAGLTSWMTLAAFNNLVAFRGGAFAVGTIMAMQLFKQPPVIDTPLQSRAIEKESWHRGSFAIIVVLEIAVAVLLWCATILFARSVFGDADPAAALAYVNRALCALLALLMFFMVGGTWFAYYIKQETLEISHVAMIAVIVVAAILFNAV
jgi:predicted small integral membrane protein